jgi:uncharacterized protein GlcG (DUF336 family)
VSELSLIKEKRMSEISLSQAQDIITAALAKGRSDNFLPLVVAVLDTGGHLKTYAREDGAGILRYQIARGKAWGALGMGVGSRALGDRAKKGGGDVAFIDAATAASHGRLIPGPGGVLIRDADGHIVGAVGISGDTGDNDEVCAIAGIEAIGMRPDPG